MLLTGAMLMAPMNVFAAETETETEAQTEAQTEASAFPFTLVTKDDQEVTFTHVPERVISTNPNTGEELMALGLGDKIIGTCYNNAQLPEQYRDEYVQAEDFGGHRLSVSGGCTGSGSGFYLWKKLCIQR